MGDRDIVVHLSAADQVWVGADEAALRERDEFIAAGPSGHAEALAVAHIILGTTKET